MLNLKKYQQHRGEKVTFEDDQIRVHSSNKSYMASVKRRKKQGLI